MTEETINRILKFGDVNKLLEYNLIEEAGKMDAPGRPMMYQTTEEFLSPLIDPANPDDKTKLNDVNEVNKLYENITAKNYVLENVLLRITYPFLKNKIS